MRELAAPLFSLRGAMLQLVVAATALVLLLSVSAPEERATGRVGFVADVAYFELEPVRNLLVTHTASPEFRATVPALAGNDAIRLLGEEAYRPLAYFELTAFGDDATSVVAALDEAMIELARWANEQRNESGLVSVERPDLVVVRPAQLEPSTTSTVAWSLLGAFAVGSALVSAVRFGSAS